MIPGHALCRLLCSGLPVCTHDTKDYTVLFSSWSMQSKGISPSAPDWHNPRSRKHDQHASKQVEEAPARTAGGRKLITGIVRDNQYVSRLKQITFCHASPRNRSSNPAQIPALFKEIIPGTEIPLSCFPSSLSAADLILANSSTWKPLFVVTVTVSSCSDCYAAERFGLLNALGACSAKDSISTVA